MEPTPARPTATAPAPAEQPVRRGSVLEVLAVFGKLGLTSFGGPVAHLGYYREELVVRRKWVDEETYADTVALCQFLPGPASTQVSVSLGTARAGVLGGLVAWAAFTLPSAIALVLFAYGVAAFGDVQDAGWLHGLKVVAVAVVALAVWGMAKSLTPDPQRITVAVAAAVAVLMWQSAFSQVLVIAMGGLVGWRLSRTGVIPGVIPGGHTRRSGVSKPFAVACLVTFAVLLVGLPVLRELRPSQPLAVFDTFYRVGSLVFGGGHVVLPLLQAEVVPPGWITNDEFLAGYGAAQAVPGPLFTFAAYLGAVMDGPVNGLFGATLALTAVFLPALLLVWGALPFWYGLRANTAIRSAMRGVNAAVVGILLAALYNPVWTSAIDAPKDFALGLAAFLLLAVWKWPPWLVVVAAAVAGAGLALLPA